MRRLTDIELHAIYFLSINTPSGEIYDLFAEHLLDERECPYHEIHIYQPNCPTATLEDYVQGVTNLVDLGLLRVLGEDERIEWEVICDEGRLPIECVPFPRDHRDTGDVILTPEGWQMALAHRDKYPCVDYGRLWDIVYNGATYNIYISDREEAAESQLPNLDLGEPLRLANGRRTMQIGKWRPTMYEECDRGFIAMSRQETAGVE